MMFDMFDMIVGSDLGYGLYLSPKPKIDQSERQLDDS